MVRKQSKKPLLYLHFEGEAIRDGRILLDDLFQFVCNFDLAIERTINVLQTGSSLRIGRPQKVSQTLSALEVVAIKKGSFDLALDLRREEQELLPGFDIGVQAVEKLMNGLSIIDESSPLPVGFDRGVLIALREAGRVLDRGIEGVHISSKRLVRFRKVNYVQSTRERIISSIRRFEQAWTTIEGRLLMADVKEDSLHCRIYPSTGSPIWCTFDEATTEQVIRNLRQFVQARGEAELDASTNRIHSFFIIDLEPIEKLSEIEITPTPMSVFWRAKDFDELAMEQGAYPVDDWAKLSGGWPEDADFESFLEAIRSSRQN